MTSNILSIPSVRTSIDISPFEEIKNIMNNWKGAFDFDSVLTDIPTPSKYPKYELLKDKKDPTHNKIRICVAGMNPDNIEISTLKNKISIKYESEKTSEIKNINDENKESDFETVVNYISNRSFNQYFSAPESYLIKVNSAEIKDGILTIDTTMKLPKDMQETKIPIKVISEK